MKDLQKLIEEKAIKRLLMDIRESFDMLHKNKVLSSMFEIGECTVSVKNKVGTTYSESLRAFLWGPHFDLDFKTSYNIEGYIYRYLLPKYIEEDSKIFMDKVEAMNMSIQEFNDNYGN